MSDSKKKNNPVSNLFLRIRQGSSGYTIILYFIILCVVITIISPNFISESNLLNNLRSAAYYGIICIGMTIVFIAGGLDLSVGSVVGLSGLVTALGLTNGVPVPLSIMLGLLVGVAVGFVNGYCIVKLKIPAVIVTLGTMFVARGFINVITEGRPVYPLPDSFNNISITTVFGVNIAVCFLIVLTVFVEFVLRKTTYGRSIYAIGGNAETARLSGIRVDRINMSVYVISGLCAAVAGIFITSRITSAQVTTGSGFEMETIAATLIGGTSMFGGVGTAIGGLFGALFMSFLKAGIVSMRLSAYWQNVVIGMILVATVGIDQYQRRKQTKI